MSETKEKQAFESTFTCPGFFRSTQVAIRLFEKRFQIEDNRKVHSIRYDSVRSFSCLTTASYVNGIAQGLAHQIGFERLEDPISTGTKFSFVQPAKFEKHDRLLGVPIPFGLPLNGTITNPENDPTLEEWKNRLSRSVVCRMREELLDEGATRWVPNVRFTSFGVEFTRRRHLLTCDFHEIRDVKLNNAELSIRTSSDSLRTLTMGAGAENFLPGLTLLNELMAPSEQSI